MLWGSNVAADGGLPDNFHSAHIYHVYIPWRMVETADQVFDWQTVEQTYISSITSRDPDATVVLRLVADYPDGPSSGIDDHYNGGDNDRDYPLFLEQAPLNIGRHVYSSCNGDGPGVAPDWNDPEFRTQATQLAEAFGQQYDGDPRITAIQVGLLGLWGEWHQSGCAAIAPDNEVKNLVKIAYNDAFTQTPLQTRYARVPDASSVGFGFHEDYFPSFTAMCIYGFPQCDDSGDWNLEYGFSQVVPAARNNWQINPVSGESPLASQKDAWVNDESDITTVLNDYHFSFLGPAGKHENSGNDAVMNRLANQLGYRFQINQFTINNPISTGSTSAEVVFTNIGSAPIYHPYQVALDWVDSDQQTIATWVFDDDLSTWLPSVQLTAQQSFGTTLSHGTYSLRIYGKSLLLGGSNFSFANQNRDTAGRVILGDINIDFDDLIFSHGFE